MFRSLYMIQDLSARLRHPLILTILGFFVCLILVLICDLPAELARRNKRTRGNMSFGIMVPKTKMFIAAVQHTTKVSASNLVGFECVSLKENLLTARKLHGCANIRCAAVDSLGRRLFFAQSNSSLFFTDAERPMARTMLLGHTLKGYALKMQCTLDCKRLVVQDSYGMYAWNIDENSLATGSPIWCELDFNIDTFELRSDCATGVLSRFDGTHSQIVEFDLQTGSKMSVIASHLSRVRTLAVSADHQFLLGIDESENLIQFDQSGRDRSINRFGDVSLRMSSEIAPAFSPNSAWLLTSDINVRDLFVWDTASQNKVCIFAHPRGSKLLGFGFLNDDEIISWGTGNSVRVWKQSESNPIHSFQL